MKNINRYRATTKMMQTIFKTKMIRKNFHDIIYLTIK